MVLSELHIYPVKSLKGIALGSAVVEQRGLQFDRRWMLVDAEGTFMTQREFPAMAAIETSVGGGKLRVSKGDTLDIPYVPDSGERVPVTIWRDVDVPALAYNGVVSEWFSEKLETPCKLVVMPADTNRIIPSEYAVRPDDTVSFADGFPFLLIGEGSLADLNSRLASPIPMNRFRPNIVVHGSEAFEEDTWKRIRIGSEEFHVVKPCARCVIPSVDQATGEKTGKDPLKTLSEYRNQNGGVMFGQNLIAETPGGTIRVGDEIEVLERRSELLDVKVLNRR